MSEARSMERLRDQSRADAVIATRHGGGMGSAISIFQIAIAFGSISLVTKKKGLWYFSMLFATAAAVRMVVVWLQ